MNIQPIKLLPPALANQIAAGEVVERPASVLKEFLENSIDASSTQIDIDIEKGGVQLIRVKDNGFGIANDQLLLAVSRHATSKISEFDDLVQVSSLGFRGEALASIASVSQLSIASTTGDDEHGWQLSVNPHDLKPKIEPVVHLHGTTVEMRDLFFNTPARRKFLRQERTEYQKIEEMIKRIALSHFEIGFTLRHNGRTIYHLPAANDQMQQEQRIKKLCGATFLQHALFIDIEASGLRLWGWLVEPDYTRSQADNQFVYVNGRVVRDKLINHALKQSYEAVIYPGRHALYVLFIELAASEVDVNVHPTKHEVRFRNSRLVHDFLVHSVESALGSEQAQAEVLTEFKSPPRQPVMMVRENVENIIPVKPLFSEKESESEFAHGHFISTYNKHYLLFDNAQGLLLINFHNLQAYHHHQILRLANQNKTLITQHLLFPQTIDMPADQCDWVAEHSAQLQEFGIELTSFDSQSVILRGLPELINKERISEFVRALLDYTIQYKDLKSQEIINIITQHTIDDTFINDHLALASILNSFELTELLSITWHKSAVARIITSTDLTTIFTRKQSQFHSDKMPIPA